MKNITLLTSATALLLLLYGCGEEKKETAPEPAPVTETFELQKEKLSSEVRLPAELQGFKQTDLYAKVSSFVKELKVDIGSQVKQGQLLIVLEAPEISSQLAAAESRLHSAEAVYMATNSTYNRILETSKVEGTISKNDLDVALSRKSSDYAQLQAAKAAYKEIQVIQSYLQIRAPFDGVISARNINAGAYVGPAGKGSELPLLTIQDQQKLRLAVSVPEMYTGYLNMGDEISFKVAPLPNKTFTAKIARRSGALDQKLRSERIEMDVINKDGKLLPGTVAEVILPLNAKDSTFVVPKTAVVNSSEAIYVVTVQDNKLHRTNVVKGREYGDKVEIYSDSLQVNQKLIKEASEEMRNGDPINKE
ncbi:efflux RND transporter periplasmic adaptor subunit [Flavobacterium sp. NRK1]|uniref:efflux RND transporter periplasmic adaptor subunit n=1 Tax=Flavobacterium sp. NRK1 TaxID=2954929 RepID=UPI002092A337|nr:efflux RND transporter periplasmic adaptor subunit [Flavobacterium sp. NRK1]MCO6149613.1 efflux RND transporter periplasmic adaptor subunit [Flavobacterium sp. NRK1]